MNKKTLISRTARSWKTGGAHIAFLDKNNFLWLMEAKDNAKPKRIDDNVAEFQITSSTLVFETTDGALWMLPLPPTP